MKKVMLDSVWVGKRPLNLWIETSWLEKAGHMPLIVSLFSHGVIFAMFRIQVLKQTPNSAEDHRDIKILIIQLELGIWNITREIYIIFFCYIILFWSPSFGRLIWFRVNSSVKWLQFYFDRSCKESNRDSLYLIQYQTINHH
jgi:hypothetical protein